jgi:putative aldouronate transport system substrate-binding protein
MLHQKRFKAMKTILIPLLALSVVTACSNSHAKNESGSKNSSDAGAPVKFSYLLAGKYINWLKDLKWFPVLEQKTNTQVELVNGGDDDTQYYKNLDLKIGSGQFPDAGIVTLSQAEVYGSQGAFLDLKPIIDKVGPNIKKYLDEHPDYKVLVTSKDGKIYGLMQEYPKISYVTFYRSDMFEKAGIKELPKTVGEFTDDLKKLKETYKNVPNFYPFTGRDNYIKFTEAFDAQDKIDASGKVHGIYDNGRGFDIYSPGFKQLVQWYISLYNDKLIDPEWVAGTATEDTWQTKMLTGKGAVSNDFFTRPSWFMNNGGPKNDPNYSMKVMNPFLDANGNQTKVAPYAPQYRIDRDFVINAKAKDKAEAIVKFIDYAFSDEGRTLMNYGVEGQSYKVENGKKEYIVKFEKEGNQPLGTPVWNFLQDRLTFPAPANNAAYYQWMDDLTKSFATTYFDKYTANYPTLKYTTDQLKERSSLLPKVQDAVNANLVKFITGKRPMSEWDAFLKEMEQTGYKKIVDIDQAAYNSKK